MRPSMATGRRKPELVAIDGSFKVDRDGAKAGVIVAAAPVLGRLTRQEYAIGEAEDLAEVVETHYVYGKRPELDALVPKDLADHLCGPGCVVTREFSPLEPDVVEHKVLRARDRGVPRRRTWIPGR